MESAFHKEKDGFEWFDEESALAQLLEDNILFCNSREYNDLFGGKGETIVLFVNCNDVFAWGCADAEDIKLEELPNLYRLWLENKRWGSTKWVCQKRNEKPQEPIENDMKKEGVWDEKMEALPENYYWKMLNEKFKNEKNKN